MHRCPSLLIFPILSALLIGCRATPAPNSPFLHNPQLMTTDQCNKTIPFDRMYVNPKFANKNFTEIYVAPVNTDYLMPPNAWEAACIAYFFPDDVHKNIALTATYLRYAFIKACLEDPTKKFKIVDHPGPNTLIVELAITQLIPSKAWLNDLGLVPVGYYSLIATVISIGLPAVTNSQDDGKGVIAMEGRTRDGQTGEIVSMFADREHPPMAILDIKSCFWWEPPKPICDGWARQFIQLQTHPQGTKIKPIPNFKLLIW